MNQELRFIECSSPSCSFRFPFDGDLDLVHYCPKCGSETRVNVYEIKKSQNPSPTFHNCYLQNKLVVILDNIRSVYNVGSIFRTADGFGIRKIYLCGITTTPINNRLHKTSLGSETIIDWEYQNNCINLCLSLINQGYSIISLENHPTALDIQDFLPALKNPKIALVVGNEKAGVDPEIIKMSHSVLSIPMAGFKESYNVAVAFGIVLYHLLSR